MPRSVVVGAMLVVGGVLVWLVGTSWGGSSPAQSERPSAVEPSAGAEEESDGEGVSELTTKRARDLEQGVNARDPDRLAEVLLVGDEHDPVEVAKQALPAGSQLVIDERTFTRLDEAGGVVDALLVGEQDLAVRLLLVNVDGRWLLAGSTEPELVS